LLRFDADFGGDAIFNGGQHGEKPAYEKTVIVAN
jgi:hypothetical protein